MREAILNGNGGGRNWRTLAEQINDFTATTGVLSAILRWTLPPSDEYDPHFVTVQIVRKIGSAPVKPTDGTTVYKGSGTTYTDTGLTAGTTYYYRAFTINSQGDIQTAERIVWITAVAEAFWEKWDAVQFYKWGKYSAKFKYLTSMFESPAFWYWVDVHDGDSTYVDVINGPIKTNVHEEILKLPTTRTEMTVTFESGGFPIFDSHLIRKGSDYGYISCHEYKPEGYFEAGFSARQASAKCEKDQLLEALESDDPNAYPTGQVPKDGLVRGGVPVYIYEKDSGDFYRKGTTSHGEVSSTKDNAYPDDGYQDGYWYVRKR